MKTGSVRGSGRRPELDWRTCFLAAPYGVDLTTLKAVLRERGIEPVVASEVAAGGSIFEQVTSAISQADLVIAVLGAEQLNPNVLYELGYAHGLGKRALVLAPPPLKHLPADIAEMLYLRAYPDNREALAFALDQVLAAGRRPKPRPTKVAGESRAIGRFADELLASLDSLGDRPSAVRIEGIVRSALEASGVSILAASHRPDIGADLAIWDDGLGASVGNPLLIEIKTSVGGPGQLHRLARQAETYVLKSNSRWLLLLYHKGPPSHELAGLPPSPILFLQIRELVDALRTSSLTEIIRDLRNRRAHGAAL